ncbi:MAG: hypothetical protein HYR85_14070 [Planctomycetes bacterium]|nr:hypothetical protein [Planctomycetota bacterium]MBI3845115.1 hypothetical protein [Planctomycetota bacterium]
MNGKWELTLEPDDYPWPTIPANSPTHEARAGVWLVHFVEGEPIEIDIPGVGARTFVPWLVESIDWGQK